MYEISVWALSILKTKHSKCPLESEIVLRSLCRISLVELIDVNLRNRIATKYITIYTCASIYTIQNIIYYVCVHILF